MGMSDSAYGRLENMRGIPLRAIATEVMSCCVCGKQLNPIAITCTEHIPKSEEERSQLLRDHADVVPLKWSQYALQISAHYGLPPEHFWPDEVLLMRTSQAVAEIDLDELAVLSGLPSPSTSAEHLALSSDVNRMLETLDPQQSMIIRRRFGLGCKAETLASIGDTVGLSSERIRALEARGLRLLRHPSRSKFLRMYAAV